MVLHPWPPASQLQVLAAAPAVTGGESRPGDPGPCMVEVPAVAGGEPRPCPRGPVGACPVVNGMISPLAFQYSETFNYLRVQLHRTCTMASMVNGMDVCGLLLPR